MEEKWKKDKCVCELYFTFKIWWKRNEKENMCACVEFCVVFYLFDFYVVLLRKKNIKWNKKCVFFAYGQYFKNIKILFFGNLLFTVGIRINKS
jgi:hypothetical protein